MIGKLTEQEIETLLFAQVLGRLGCHHDHVTYVVPISYAYDGNYIYCHTRDGMKVQMMRQNPNVCFEVESFADMANWQTVIAWGIYEELSNDSERNEALQCLLNRVLPPVSSQTTHLSPSWPFPPAHLNEIKGVVFRISLLKKTGRFEKYQQMKT